MYKLSQIHSQIQPGWQSLKLEIAFPASTRCLSVCVFNLPGRHAMLLQCTTMYAGTGHSNTKYNTK